MRNDDTADRGSDSKDGSESRTKKSTGSESGRPTGSEPSSTPEVPAAKGHDQDLPLAKGIDRMAYQQRKRRERDLGPTTARRMGEDEADTGPSEFRQEARALAERVSPVGETGAENAGTADDTGSDGGGSAGTDQGTGDGPVVRRSPQDEGTNIPIGPANDRYEREADRIARRALTGEGTPDSPSSVGGTTAQRDAKTGGSGGDTAPESVVETVSSGGQPLDAGVRSEMESRMGQDFGGVTVHTGPQAARSAREIGARAYTVGTHVAFNSGEYAPGTPEGKHLLAHELAHVSQQASGDAIVQGMFLPKGSQALKKFGGSIGANVMKGGVNLGNAPGALKNMYDHFNKSRGVGTGSAPPNATAIPGLSTSGSGGGGGGGGGPPGSERQFNSTNPRLGSLPIEGTGAGSRKVQELIKEQDRKKRVENLVKQLQGPTNSGEEEKQGSEDTSTGSTVNDELSKFIDRVVSNVDSIGLSGDLSWSNNINVGKQISGSLTASADMSKDEEGNYVLTISVGFEVGGGQPVGGQANFTGARDLSVVMGGQPAPGEVGEIMQSYGHWLEPAEQAGQIKEGQTSTGTSYTVKNQNTFNFSPSLGIEFGDSNYFSITSLVKIENKITNEYDTETGRTEKGEINLKGDLKLDVFNKEIFNREISQNLAVDDPRQPLNLEETRRFDPNNQF